MIIPELDTVAQPYRKYTSDGGKANHLHAMPTEYPAISQPGSSSSGEEVGSIQQAISSDVKLHPWYVGVSSIRFLSLKHVPRAPASHW